MAPKPEVRDLAWVKARVKRDRNGCWIWQKARTVAGYGKSSSRRPEGGFITRNAHRVVYEILVGQVPAHLSVCHQCDVRLCVNPDHMFLGDAKANNGDAAKKGRTARGSRNANAALHETDLPKIRKMYARGKTYVEIAAHFGVHWSCIGRAIRDGFGGMHPIPDRVARTRFTTADVLRVRAMRERGLSFSAICKEAGIGYTQAWNMVNKRSAYGAE